MSGAVLGIWWVWVALAFILGIVEVFAPAYIFLGFALGALATALFVAVASGPAAAVVIAIFAVASLLAWGCLRDFHYRKRLPGRTPIRGARIIA